ncbi:LysR substrate-binding domain-containing protein [Haloactinomyces albus]|uniref:DNA-binding transcriptional LysR family regulator n=1 Tax=Haloactinomyces albus TaxID=1352928 RepID=A0AAE3ZFK9_9ACTN|nr:LysR substrate-binding domain-containing protein [Haloactinomyces albus]MDR7303015.1 DNA-binding transcriptional LysR family regulator [Haloactinomyces albus]
MNPDTVDLNLLRALRALLEERTVTGAAERMGVSQPSMSASLARLRRHFDDDLLVRSGRQHRLTPLARRLQQRTQTAVRAADRVFESQPDFDPAGSKRQFHIIASDYDTSMIARRLTGLLAKEAPRTRLAITTVTTRHVEGCPETLLDCDLLMLPHGMITDAAHQDLFRDEWQCIVAADNPVLDDRVTVEQLESFPWVAAYETATSWTTVARALRTLGIDLHVQVTMQSFLAIPEMVAGTDRIAVLPRRLVERFPADAGVRALPCPVDAGPLVEAMWWHPFYDDDPEHEFLRDVVLRATAPLREPE